MKITKRIDYLLKQRTQYALKLDNICGKIDDYLIQNNINPDSACWLTGCEIYVNPYIAEEEVRRAILEKE